MKMSCELAEYCQFFNDKMQNMPKTAAFIKERLCFGDYASCNRFRIYKKFGKENIPLDLGPDDIEEVKKVIDCLQKKQGSKEPL